jgi:hypothetical protein
MATTDWDIGKTSLVCASTGRELTEREDIYSALYEEAGTFVRRDYGLDAWPPDDLDQAFSYWKTRVPAKDAPAKKYVDDDVVMDFFRRLSGRDDAEKLRFRYVLALFLMRRKRLKFAQIKHDGETMVMVLYDRITRERHEVVDPGLTEEQVGSVSEQVGQILNTKL